MSIKLKTAYMALSVFLLFLYLGVMDINSYTLRAIVVALILINVIGIVTIKKANKIILFYHDLQFSVFVIILLFYMIELLRFCPGVIPLQIRQYLRTDDIQNIRKSVVEYLEESPYVKFKPNTIIKSQGYRGTPQQFAYEWKTDKNGFKNSTEIAEETYFQAVALGDSFTEGMGVTIEDAWPTLLSKKGILTYNLGVQGYAPSQMEGSFRQYGLKLKPKYVIIGYCSSTYNREALYLENHKKKNRKFTGGISSIVESEIRSQTKHVTSALYLLITRNYSTFIRNKFSHINHNSQGGILNKYSGEISEVTSKKFNITNVQSSKEWQQALESLSNIKKMSKQIGAETILLYFPQRGFMYYEKATGSKLPSDNYEEIESLLLRMFAEKEMITYIDPSDKIIKYVNSLKNDCELNSYPYLELDGHLSPAGNRIIAEEIIHVLKSLER